MNENYPQLSEEERKAALDKAVAIIRKNLPDYTYKCQQASTVNGIYAAIENTEWTSGFWPGEISLAYEYTGDEVFSAVNAIYVESFLERIRKKISVDHHDMGFLYTPSCVSQWMLKRNAHAREAAILAADQLLSRFQDKGQFLQAWGAYGAEENYRFIIDCLLNLPLLYWASEETGDDRYRKTADAHTATCLRYSFRDDFSTFHTFFMDPKTGGPVRGETCQGYRADSSWARGQAWGIYGLALSYRHTGNLKCLELFEPVSEYFLSRLPEDLIPYWDLIFTSGAEPRDSSSGAIAACGFLEAAESFRRLGNYEKADRYTFRARQLLKAIYDKCLTEPDDQSCNGIVKHGTYSNKSPYNTCTPAGVDECVSWGDYFWMEALMRLSCEWKCYW